MKVLFIAMPDNASCFDRVMKMPNLGICSVAGSLPPDVDVKILDLTLKNKKISQTVSQLVRDYQPDVVGLSAMSFQFQTAARLARLIKEIAPRTKIAVGGYHATLLYKEIS